MITIGFRPFRRCDGRHLMMPAGPFWALQRTQLIFRRLRKLLPLPNEGEVFT